MRPLALLVSALSVTVLAIWTWHGHATHSLRVEVSRAAQADAALPQRVLWVWERPEDLRVIDPRSTAVAVLEETIRLGSSVSTVVRRQPFAMPSGTTRIAVVRLETLPGFSAQRGDSSVLEDTTAQLLRVADNAGTAALQIDFDARRSERDFYRRLLENVRQRMPEGMPLEMTALASWCSNDGWIADLPVNRAVPMFFRMEPDRRRMLVSSAATWRVTEPLCSGSIGVSTSEPWPPDVEHKRVYLFPDHGWKRDAAWLTAATGGNP